VRSDATVLAQPQQDDLDAGPRQAASGTERFCAATGKVKPVAEMIRFVLAPDGAAVADLKRRLPGRGIWITATRLALQRAIARKAFARSFRRDVRVAPDFVADTERLLERSALDALAIARKAGSVAVGFTKAETAIVRGAVVALLHAQDAAADGRRKLKAAVRQRFEDRADRIATVDVFTSVQLDLALGRPNVIHAALQAGPASETFLARVARLERFRTGDPSDRDGRDPLSTGT
jgi:predicted RNA-binding protein YlxR (DUF448 family)